VKARFINQGAKKILLTICSDITKVKQFESMQKRIRSNFFSSVAHELRTPLNTVLPMLLVVLNQLPRDHPSYERLYKYLKIIYSSSIHLQNVIEDALDVSRIENGKFQVNKDNFELPKALQEVADIMQFQIEQKNL
jgi:signal transduction histidine kinase